MKKLFLSIMMAAVLAWPLNAVAGEANDKNKMFRDLNSKYQQQQATSAGEGQASNAVISIIPQYHFAKHGTLQTTLGGTNLKSDAGESSTGNVVFTVDKQVSEMLKLSFMYQFAYSDYSGGMLVPDMPGLNGQSDIQVTSNLVGAIGEINFNDYGRLQLSLIQAFDSYDGTETLLVTGQSPDTRTANGFDVRVTSLMAWYEKDFNLNESWNLTPYVGWRSIYADLSGQNDFSPGTTALDKKDSNDWTHLVSGGLKLGYQAGPLGLSFRAGVNHRLSSDDVPGFGSRAMSPGAVQLGYMVNMDRTVASFGTGLNYVIPEYCVIAAGYDGAVGSDTNIHTGTLALVFPF